MSDIKDFVWNDDLIKEMLYKKFPIPQHYSGDIQKCLNDFKQSKKPLTEPQKNKVILVSFNQLESLFTEEEIYPYGNFTNKLKEFFKSKINQ